MQLLDLSTIDVTAITPELHPRLPELPELSLPMATSSVVPQTTTENAVPAEENTFDADTGVDEIVGTYVSPSKLARIKRGLVLATERHKCALKLLDNLFSKQELSNGNIRGAAGKNKLDETRIGMIKREWLRGAVKYDYFN